MHKELLSALCGAALLAPVLQSAWAAGSAGTVPIPDPAMTDNKLPASADAPAAETDQDLSALLGATVVDATGEELGEVYDIVKGPDGSDQLIVETGGFMGIGGRLVAVPLDTMTTDPDTGLVTLSAMNAEEFATLDDYEEVETAGSIRQGRAADEEPASEADVPTEY